MSDNAPYMQIFVAYASEDKKAKALFLPKLKALKNEYNVSFWYKKETNIRRSEIQKQLKNADIVLLLLSNDFLKSDYYKTIKRQLSKPHNSEIIPVLFRKSNWENDDFLNGRKLLPEDRKLIVVGGKSEENQGRDCESVIEEIKDLLSKNILNGLPKPEKNEKVENSQKTFKNLRAKLEPYRLAFITIVSILSFLLVLLPIICNKIKKDTNSQKEEISKPIESISLYGKPIFSKEDTLFKFLIVRFEDTRNEEDDTYCIGRSIEDNLIQLKEKGLPIKWFYADDIPSPKYSESAKELQKHHNADVLIYGRAEEIEENCNAANVCFRRVVADTIMADVALPEKIDRINHNFNEPVFITIKDIEQGNYSIDKQVMEAWVISLIAFKNDDVEGAIAQVDKMIGDLSNLNRKEQATKYLNRGKAYYGFKQYKKAILDYDKAIALSPSDTVYNSRANVYLVDKQIQKAIMDYRKAIEINSENGDSHHGLGIAYWVLKKYKEAIQYYDRALESRPNDIEIHHNRGHAYFLSKEYEKAISDYSYCIELDSNFIRAYKSRVNAYRAENNHEASIPDLRKIIKANPNDPNSNGLMAMAQLMTKRPDSAISYINKALELKQNANGYVLRGQAHTMMNNDDEAISDFNRAIKMEPHNSNAYNNRGGTHADIKNYKKAIADFDKAIELSPKSSSYYFNRGTVYQEISKCNIAILDYSEAVRLNPENIGAYNNRAICYREIEKYEKAVEDYTKLTELQPDSAKFYQNRGCAYVDWHQYDNAISSFEEAIELDSSYVNAYIPIGFAYTKLNEYDKAEGYYSKAIRLHPDAHAYNNRGYVYLKQNKLGEAKIDLVASQEIDPENSWVYSNWSIYYTTENDFPKAIQNLKKAIELGYDDKEFLQEEELLAPLRSHPEWQEIINSIDDKNSEE